MIGIVIALIFAAVLLGLVEGTRNLGRRRERARALAQALTDPHARGPAIERLRAQIRVLLSGGTRAQLFGRRSLLLEAAELRLDLAVLLLAEDRPEEALDELAALDPNRLPRALQAMLALNAVEAHLRLSEWDAAERVLDGYSPDGLNDNGRALRASARAQISIGRGEPRSALRILDELSPVPAEVRDELQVTRARALAADGRATDEVWSLLSGLPRGALELLVRRHGGEPATQLARRLLDGEGPYR